jgi:hypothetical protein
MVKLLSPYGDETDVCIGRQLGENRPKCSREKPKKEQIFILIDCGPFLGNNQSFSFAAGDGESAYRQTGAIPVR